MMNAWITSTLKVLSLTVFLFALSMPATADSLNHRLVNDVDIYLAVLPAEMTQGVTGIQHEVKNHANRYHVVVSLFDADSGKRIQNAKVQVSVRMVGGVRNQEKNLEPMLIMNAASYGHYFLMPEAGEYRLSILVETAKRKYEIATEFLFDRPKN